MKTTFQLLFAVASVLGSAIAGAATIDFESVPNGAPADKLAISTQFVAAYGVAFSTSDGKVPYLEAVGGSDSAYGFINNVRGLYDTAAVGYESQLGQYFLRLGTGSLLSTPIPSLLISYQNPVAAASAQIWDIDGDGFGTEQWRVDALDQSGVVIDSLLSPLGTASDSSSLDGKPWTWSFDHGSAPDIYRISLTFTGSKRSDVGLAFDNFSPTSPVPIPSSGILLSCALALGLVAVRRRGTVLYAHLA